MRTPTEPPKPTVFVSYSHKDELWKDRLRPHLGVLEQVGDVTIWDDRDIGAGADWYDEIREVMERAAVAVCLISADYLASDFVHKEEIPYLLERREKEGMVLIPVLLRPCLWTVFHWLTPIQMIPHDGKSVAGDFKNNWDEPFAQVAERIHEVVTGRYERPAPPPPRWALPEKIDIHRMPVTGAELFGRRAEMAMLDQAWDSGRTYVVSLVAWGGVGKSTLVNKWLERMAADNYRGARRVFAWSFYSQGTGERVTSADQFIAQALDWFGDPDPTAGSPWAKGERLAGLVRRERTLLVLDGLEPLQSGLDYERGKVTDPGLAVLISELARDNPGLCVITTRGPVADLNPFPDTTRQEDLEQISAEAGRALLRVGGVRGTDAALEGAARDFGTHALALNLLAAYLHGIHGHHVSHADEIPDLPDVPAEAGKHPRRVMAAFAARFGDGPEVELLRMLGLFDRPAGAEEIAALRAAPPIPGLTAHVQGLSEGEWLRLLEQLRETGLVAPKSTHRPDVLDAHPLVREHFGAQLRQEHPDAWREGNDRLYEHLKAAAPERPDTLEEMMPLFAAVAHGCQAGRHQETLDEVYWRRIQRGREAYSIHKLGAFGADLAALSGFFDPPWRKPVDGITEAWRGFVPNEAGFDLRALGRLAEAAQPMQATLEAELAREDWKNAAIAAGNLSELHLTIGDLAQALDYARRSVDLADRSGDGFQRMSKRTTLADALHQAGRLDEAEELFREAEAMQEERQPQFPLLYSLRGYRYCDLLLGQGKTSEVLRRAEQTLEWAIQYLQSGGGLLDIALGHLSLGRAHLLQAQREGTEAPSATLRTSLIQAATHLNRAVDGLRQAGQQQELPRGLLARAALHRAQAQFARAQRDLEEALTIATRGGMRLHEADCHLESARLHLARGEQEQARESLSEARAMVEEMGYHRRDGEVAAVEELLEAEAPSRVDES
jgi:tetratricopeptide (TPR) repeat protein